MYTSWFNLLPFAIYCVGVIVNGSAIRCWNGSSTTVNISYLKRYVFIQSRKNKLIRGSCSLVVSYLLASQIYLVNCENIRCQCSSIIKKIVIKYIALFFSFCAPSFICRCFCIAVLNIKFTYKFEFGIIFPC